MYSVDFVKPSDIECVKNEWKALESSKDMTYFQLYDWYNSIVNLVLKDCWMYETRVAIVRKEGCVSLIAPLWILKHGTILVNKRGCYFWGRYGWSDYLNFIYRDFDCGAYEFLVAEIKRIYKISTFYWEQVKECTSFYEYLQSKQVMKCDKITECVSLSLAESKEMYIKTLSKSSRQNIRTANNRLLKEGLDLEFVFDDTDFDKLRCCEMRNKRLIQKNKPKNVLSWIKQSLLKFVQIPFNIEVPFITDEHSKMMVAYSGGEIRAFFNYGINKYDKTIVVMAVGTDELFERYSPGMLLMYNFILTQIETQAIVNIDFTRGTERYKYALGGKEHRIHNFTMKYDT